MSGTRRVRRRAFSFFCVTVGLFVPPFFFAPPFFSRRRAFSFFASPSGFFVPPFFFAPPDFFVHSGIFCAFAKKDVCCPARQKQSAAKGQPFADITRNKRRKCVRKTTRKGSFRKNRPSAEEKPERRTGNDSQVFLPKAPPHGRQKAGKSPEKFPVFLHIDIYFYFLLCYND